MNYYSHVMYREYITSRILALVRRDGAKCALADLQRIYSLFKIGRLYNLVDRMSQRLLPILSERRKVLTIYFQSDTYMFLACLVLEIPCLNKEALVHYLWSGRDRMRQCLSSPLYRLWCKTTSQALGSRET